MIYVISSYVNSGTLCHSKENTLDKSINCCSSVIGFNILNNFCELEGIKLSVVITNGSDQIILHLKEILSYKYHP